MHKYDEVAKKRKTQQTEAIGRCYRWEELPNGPLIEIAQHLSNFEDLEALHLVCTRWYSVLRASCCKLLVGRGQMSRCSPQVPWLMMTQQEGVEIDEQRGRPSSTLSLRPCSTKGKAMRLFFYRLSFQRVRELVIRLPPQLELAVKEGNINNYCLYSSHGWLLVLMKGSTMCLYNPFCAPTHNYIPLPRNLTLECRARRFTLSASPCTKSYVVMIVYRDTNLAIWRPGDEGWTLVEPPLVCKR